MRAGDALRPFPGATFFVRRTLLLERPSEARGWSRHHNGVRDQRTEINLATGETTAYYPWAGQPLPMRQGGPFYLLHSDRNGSITAVTDNAGSLVGQQRYTAYGKLTQSGNFPTDRGYTGQIRDGSDSGSLWDFYFFTSRYYHAAIGKFAQPIRLYPIARTPHVLNHISMADASGMNATRSFAINSVGSISCPGRSLRGM